MSYLLSPLIFCTNLFIYLLQIVTYISSVHAL
nr:MAG TPA: hypothetical protein [Caudoviricetes sp.]